MSKGIAVRKMLKQSGDSLFAACHWCAKQCVWHQKLPKDTILNDKSNTTYKFPGGTVKFSFDGKVIYMQMATVDHVLEKSKGGTNSKSNLVISCARCNSQRSTPKNPQRWTKNCMQCGGDKPANKHRRCKSCMDSNQQAVLIEKGLWDEHRALLAKAKERRNVRRRNQRNLHALDNSRKSI